MQENYVVGISHLDLGFVFGEEELQELLELYIERMLSILDRFPESRFALEQICHYKGLKERRPDLFKRVKELLKENRIEMMGAMASSAETNFPNGECFVRNQLMGLRWAKEHLDTEPTAAWLVDTFGINAQVPQILNQFGFKELFANRFGGNKRHDLFYANGIDGTKMLVLGRDSNTHNLLPNSQSLIFCRSRKDVDTLFRVAQNLKGDCPHLVVYYTENQEYLGEYFIKKTEELNAKGDAIWKLASYKEYLEALHKAGFEAPVISADLNPEFTGTYALRNQIHMENRIAETLLMEAEKWSALLHYVDKNEALSECWWKLFYNQFHDVFSGSHEDATYFDVLDKFTKIKDTSRNAINEAIGGITKDSNSIVCLNGLPWKRKEWIEVGEEGKKNIRLFDDDKALPMAVCDNKVYAQVEIPATGMAQFNVQVVDSLDAPLVASEEDTNEISNEFVSLKLDAKDGIKALQLSGGKKIMEEVPDFLVAEKDLGEFQIEAFDGTEIYAMNGKTALSKVSKSPLGESIELSGEFKNLNWNREENYLKWNANFTLRKGEGAVRLHLSIDWKGESSRIRLKFPCNINSAKAIYEIPFGVVERSSYGPLPTARGEWPAHRFVAYEDGDKGMAIVNNGLGNVELVGQTLAITLIRAYGDHPGAWVKPTEVSSQHGKHEYDFMLIPYEGTYKEADVVRMAQEFNNQIIVVENKELISTDAFSGLEIDKENIVLSTVKFAEDNSGDLIIRYYETFGEETAALIKVSGAKEVYMSDVKETLGEKMACENGEINISCKAFEIQTLRIKM